MPGKAIAATVGVSAATVSRTLKRLELSKLSALESANHPADISTNGPAR
jgi:hypothetical protein